jgi:hypothetical protein
MIEIVTGSLAAERQSSALLSRVSEPEGKPVEVSGEVVDTKCFLGVMVPGSGKTHRACAALCLRGDIPPALHVHDRDGRSTLLLLAGPGGDRVTVPAVQAAGRAIALNGIIRQEHGWRVLLTDPASWHTTAATR